MFSAVRKLLQSLSLIRYDIETSIPRISHHLLTCQNLQTISKKDGDMGGLGSGRIGKSRRYVGNCLHIDVNDLRRNGLLQEGTRSEIQWTEDGRVTDAVSVDADFERIWLRFRIQTPVLCTQVEQHVNLIKSPCRFGGNRVYFVCPGNCTNGACARFVQHLHLAEDEFLCRHCHGMTYRSQYRDEMERATATKIAISRSLGGKGGRFDPLPNRPKGMWHRTYSRLSEKFRIADEEAERLIREDVEDFFRTQ